MLLGYFRALQEVTRAAHTPHVRDIGRLMFRNHCLLDSRVFRPLCLAAYALVHEADGLQNTSFRTSFQLPRMDFTCFSGRYGRYERRSSAAFEHDMAPDQAGRAGSEAEARWSLGVTSCSSL